MGHRAWSMELEYFELQNWEPARRVGVRGTIAKFEIENWTLCSMLHAPCPMPSAKKKTGAAVQVTRTVWPISRCF